jgi:hypothetical protein
LAKRFQRRRILKIFDPLTNMATTGNYFFRLVDF